MRRVLLVSVVFAGWMLPARGQEAALPAQSVRDLKAATVFLKTRVGALAQSGTGFVIQSSGDSCLVVTNQHVVGSRVPGRQPGRATVLAVFRSGAKDESSANAEVLAADASRDLAILRVKGVANPPRPIDLAQKPELVETMTIYTFGFPFGEALATSKKSPAIAIGRGTVSSIRLDEFDRVSVVQIDGALNPGNSGGPVVDAKGRLVGVAVATIRGANNIGLAIPPDQVDAMLNGRIGDVVLDRKPQDGGEVEVTVTAHLIDPLNKIKSVALLHAAAGAQSGAPKPAADGTWAKLPDSMRVELKVNGQQATGSFRVRPPAKGADQLWIQPTFLDARGKTHYAQPAAFTANAPRAVADRSGREGMPATKGDRPEDEPKGGFSKDALRKGKKGGAVASAPRATGESLQGEVREVDDLKVTEIQVEAQEVPRCLFWAADGKAFFVLEKTGTLRRVALEGFREELRWETGQACAWLSQSAAGLLLTISGRQEVWVVDPSTFAVKHKIAVPSVDRAVSSPKLWVAYATDRRGEELSVLGLKKGEPLRRYGPRDFGGARSGFAHLAASPDGKFLFAQGGIEQLVRYRVDGTGLVPDAAGDRIAQNGRAVEVSPDGYYVALPSGGGNGARPYSTNVYKVNKLATPEIVIESGPYPQALGFDTKAGYLYAQNMEHPLIVFLPSGLKHKEYASLGGRRSGPGNSARQFAVHPDGGKLLLLTDSDLYFVELPAQEEAKN